MNNKGAWAIGGTTLIGIGIGFVFLALWGSSLLLIASVLVGIGLGLLIASLMSKE